MKGGSSFAPRDAGLLVLLALLWGFSFVFIKTAVAEVAPAWVVATRLIIGAVVVVAAMIIVRDHVPRDGRVWFWLLIIGVFGTGLPWFGQAWAQRQLDSGLTAVLNAMTPVATLVLAVAIGLERLHRARVTGLTIALAGTLIIIGGEIGAGGPIAALVVASLAPFAYGLGSVLTRQHLSGRVRSIPAVALQLALTAVVVAPLATLTSGAPPEPGELSWPVRLSLLALGALGTGAALLIFFALIERVGATNASMVTYLVPIVGLAAGAAVRGERFGVNVFAGAAVLITGIYIAQREPVAAGDVASIPD